MKIRVFVPHSKEDLEEMDLLGKDVEKYYLNKKEMFSDHGYCDYCYIDMDNIFIQMNDNYYLSLDDISMN